MSSAGGKTIADLIENRFGLPTEAGRDLPAEGTVAQILAHRTQRRYRPDPVPESVLEILLAAALSAPSKSDLQQVAVIVVRDREKQTTIGSWIHDMPWIATAPLFMVLCGDHRRLRRVFELRGRPFPNDTLDMFMNAAVDAGLVLQNFITAAEALGLGCCPISVVRNHVEKLAELLELPPLVFPVAGLCAGYPSQPGWISMRLPPAVTVHTDRYDDGDLPDQLEEYDRRREARHATPRESQRFPRPLRLRGALRVVRGQGPAVLGARAPQFWTLRARPRLQPGLITWGAPGAPQTPHPLVAPRRSRGAPRPHVSCWGSGRPPNPPTLVAPRQSRGAPRQAAYFASIFPTRRTPSASRFASASKKARNSAPCLNVMGVSSFPMAALKSGSSTAVRIASRSLASTGSAVPRGANRPAQM